MEIMEIIKDALVFPSTDLRTFFIFVLLTIFAGVFGTVYGEDLLPSLQC